MYSRIVEEIPRDQDAIFARTVSTGMPTLAANRAPARKRTKDFRVLARFSPTRSRSASANLVRNLLSPSDHGKPIRLGEFFRALYYPLLRKVTPGGNASDARPDITDSLICPLENARRANATLLEV